MNRRQFGAVARRKADARFDREHQRMGDLLGLGDEPAPDPYPVVGWMQKHPDTVKGANHRCITCQPERPGKGHWEPVHRNRLAATMACTACGTVLERVQL